MNNFKREPKTCDMCGASFIPYNSRQIYCSHKCYDESMRTAKGLDESSVGEDMVCGFCGKHFIKKHPKQKYCDQECAKRMTYSLKHKSALNRVREHELAQKAGLCKRKFDPHKCLRCIYSGGADGAGVAAVYCNYHALAEDGTRTCLRADDHGNKYDIRGEIYDNCLMFKSRGRTRRKHGEG